MSRRTLLVTDIAVGAAAFAALLAAGAWHSLVFPFFVGVWLLVTFALATRRRALHVHALVGLVLVLFLIAGGGWGALVLPFFLVAWLATAALVVMLDRGPRAVRPLRWLLPAALPAVTFTVMAAFFVAIR